jgi:transcriptional regulator with XRE-family HTH domain
MNILDFIRRRRSQLGFACRDFAVQLQIKPSDWNRIENGRAQFPDDEDFRNKLASALMIQQEESDWFHRTLCNYKVQNRPPLSEQELIAKLPVVFRKSDGTRLTKAEALKLASHLRRELA